MTFSHYDRIAATYQSISSISSDQQVFEGDNPELVFWEMLASFLPTSKRVLDLGCGDGTFTQKVLNSISSTSTLTAIDGSRATVALARQHLIPYRAVTVIEALVGQLPFKSGTFDLVYSRRGPTLSQQQSIVSNNGHYLELRVAEQDTADLQQVFQRGQFYSKRQSAVATLKKIFPKPWTIIEITEHRYRDYFGSLNKLARYLTMTPSIPEFNIKKDVILLARYAKDHHDSKGIYLERHRVIFLARRGAG